MDVLALIIAGLLILLLMRGCLPLSLRRSSPPRTYIPLYLRCIFNSWLLLGIVGIIVLHDGIPLSSIGLLLPTLWWPTLLAFIGVSFLFSLLLVMHLRAIKYELFTAEVKRRLALPRTSSERLLWVGLSLNAGIWEEIVFRGFLPWYFLHHLTFFGFSIPLLWAASLSLILFSLCHLYQGWRGALFVGLVGITLTLFYAITGNLLASILWHFLWDARFSLGAPTSESPTPATDEMKALPVSHLQPLPSLPLLDRPWRPARKPPQCRHKRNRRDQPIQRIPYYARRSSPYPNMRAGRHQQLDSLWKKYHR